MQAEVKLKQKQTYNLQTYCLIYTKTSDIYVGTILVEIVIKNLFSL